MEREPKTLSLDELNCARVSTHQLLSDLGTDVLVADAKKPD